MKRIRSITAIILTIVLLVAALCPALVLAENLRYGSRGEKVKELQKEYNFTYDIEEK